MNFKVETNIKGRPVSIKFDLYDLTIENAIMDSHDWTLYGHETVESFKENYTNQQALEVLKKYTHGIDKISNRVDILFRTNPTILSRLEQINKLDHIIALLMNVNEDTMSYLEDTYSFNSLDEVFDVLDLD